MYATLEHNMTTHLQVAQHEHPPCGHSRPLPKQKQEVAPQVVKYVVEVVEVAARDLAGSGHVRTHG